MAGISVSKGGGGGAGLAPHVVEGRLTLSSGSPVDTNPLTNQTTVYFSPFKGNRVCLYDGSDWDLYEFTEKSIALPAAANQVYDVFGYLSAGTIALELLAWTNDTTRATNVVYFEGVYTKSGDNTRLYLGSVRTHSVAGQTDDSYTRRYLWNYYNRILRYMQRSDFTVHAYNVAAWRYWNNDPTQIVEFLIGILEEPVLIAVNGWRTTGNYNSIVAAGYDGASPIGPLYSSAISRNGGAGYRFSGVGKHFFSIAEYGGAAANFHEGHIDVSLWG